MRYAIDTGPLVALLSRGDVNHRWARQTLDSLEPPLFTCEAVLSETCFLGREAKGDPDDILALVERGLLVVDFRVGPQTSAVRKLMTKYADVSMSLADACLVRMTELDAEMTVITTDDAFAAYRRVGRGAIPTLMP